MCKFPQSKASYPVGQPLRRKDYIHPQRIVRSEQDATHGMYPTTIILQHGGFNVRGYGPINKLSPWWADV